MVTGRVSATPPPIATVVNGTGYSYPAYGYRTGYGYGTGYSYPAYGYGTGIVRRHLYARARNWR